MNVTLTGRVRSLTLTGENSYLPNGRHDRRTPLHPLYHIAQALHELTYKALVATPLALVGVFWPGPRDETPEA